MGKESDLYDPLNTKTIGGDLRLDVDTYENVQDNIHIEGVNRKLLELTDLVGRVTNNRSDSGPISSTQKIASTGAVTTSTNTVLFRPDPGQVWVCTGVQMDASAGSGSVTAVLMYYDGSNEVRIEAASTAGVAEFNITSTAGPLYVSNDVYLRIVTSSVAVGEQATFNASVIRVR
jgi:hypothetical protein